MRHGRYASPVTGGRLNMVASMTAPDAAPGVRGGQVLYLDFDGVLHPEDVRRCRRRGRTLPVLPATRFLSTQTCSGRS
jgi:hypothetical protein